MECFWLDKYTQLFSVATSKLIAIQIPIVFPQRCPERLGFFSSSFEEKNSCLGWVRPNNSYKRERFCRAYIFKVRIYHRSLEQKIVTRTLEGGGGQSDPLSTFGTIHPIDMKFGTHNELSQYFQLTSVTWF